MANSFWIYSIRLSHYHWPFFFAFYFMWERVSPMISKLTYLILRFYFIFSALSSSCRGESFIKKFTHLILWLYYLDFELLHRLYSICFDLVFPALNILYVGELTIKRFIYLIFWSSYLDFQLSCKSFFFCLLYPMWGRVLLITVYASNPLLLPHLCYFKYLILGRVYL